VVKRQTLGCSPPFVADWSSRSSSSKVRSTLLIGAVPAPGAAPSYGADVGRTGLVVAAVMLLVAGCGGDDGGTSGAGPGVGTRPAGTASSSGHPASDQPAVDPASPGFPPTRSATVVSRRSFTSPTGNIACQLTRDGAACVIAEHDYPANDRPDGCTGRWLPLLEVDLSGAARLGPCEAGVVAPSGGALAYGTTSAVGPMSCLSRLTGMVCWSGRSGHGFRLARAAYQLR
jgi:hypothetical protein